MTALILTLGASIFLLKSNLGLTPKTISELSKPLYGYSRPVAKNFAQQTANTRVGVILLFIAFALQLINALWQMRWKDFDVNWHGIFIAIGFCTILLTISHWYSKSLSERIHKNTLEILEEKKEQVSRSSTQGIDK